MRDLTADERKRSIEFLTTPEHWPYWPVLPMKGPDHVTGFVTADYPTIVLKQAPNTKGIMLQLAYEAELPNVLGPPSTRADLPKELQATYERQVQARYEDVDGMLDAGWRID